jgi:cysteine desulfurase
MNYFDYAASAPVRSEALNAFCEASAQFYANSESLHDLGTSSQDFLNHARKKLAEAMNVSPDGIYFTSGGSESNFLAITSLALGRKHKGKHIVSSPLEHPSVLNTLDYLQSQGFEISFLPVRNDGLIHVEDIGEHIRHDTILAVVQHANSEIGTIQRVDEIGMFLQERNVLLHTDCCQSFGKAPLVFPSKWLGSVAVSSHKIGGPKGTGAVYIAPGNRIRPIVPNGVHERGFKQGTVDVPSVASFVTAAMLAVEELPDWEERINSMRNTLLSIIMNSEDIAVERTHASVLPHFIPVRIKGMEGQYAMLELNRRRHAVSPGSACKAGHQEPSRALLALGRTEDEARELVRITIGKENTAQQITELGLSLLEVSKAATISK